MGKKYYDEINILKGLAMLFAVVGHSLPDASKDFWIVGHHSFSEFLYYWIYSFHMAAFFSCAGFLFIPKIAKDEVGISIAKRAKRLMIPYFFYSLSYLFMKSIFSSFADHPLEDNAFILMFFGVSPSYGCWFLWVLFMISLFFIALRNVEAKWLVLIALGLYLLSTFVGNNYLIGHIGDVMRHSLWFAIGGYVAVKYDRMKKYLKNLWLGMLAFASLTVLQFVNCGINSAILLMIFKTMCGIEMVYSLSCFLTENYKNSLVYRGVKLIGDYCMDIYLLSMFVLVPMRILYVNFGMMNYINYYIYVLISVFVGIAIPYYLSKCFIRKNKILSMLLIGG